MTSQDYINFAIIVVILVGLVKHRYLSTFWELNTLPFPFGFLMFANLFTLIYTIALIRMFGFGWGLLLSGMCFFQVMFSFFLWVFQIPTTIKINKTIGLEFFGAIAKPNIMIYGSFSMLVILLPILIGFSFFFSPYKSSVYLIEEYLNLWIVLGIMLVGNISRIFVMSILAKD